MRAGLVDAAVANYTAAVEIQRNAVGEKSRRYAASAAELGGAHLAGRRPERAIGPLSGAQAYFAGSQDTMAPLAPARLAAALSVLSRSREAEQLLGAIDDSGWEVMHRRGQVARAVQRFEEALALQQRSLSALKQDPADQVARAEVSIEMGHALLGLQRQLASAMQYGKIPYYWKVPVSGTTPWQRPQDSI